MIDDPTLLRRYLEDRSESAFAELVQRHLPLVYSAALRRTMGNSHRAQEIAQTVFTKLARDGAALSRHPTLTAWLYTATRNAAIDAIRSEQRRLVREHEAHTMNEITSSSESAADWDQLRPVLDDAMDDLDPRDREAVLLRYFQGHAFATIAAALRVSEDAARKRLNRALDKLRAHLARRGITSSTAALATVLAAQTSIAAPATAATIITTAALAGASTATSAGLIGALTFMSTTKIISVTATAIAVLAIGVAVHQTKATRAAVAALDTERDTLGTNISALEQRLQESVDATALARKELADVRAAQAVATPLSVAPPQGENSTAGRQMSYILDHPETHPAYLQQQVLRSKTRYDRFFKAANLSPAEQEQILAAIKERANSELDLMQAKRAQGYDVAVMPTDPAARARVMQVAQEMNTRFATSLRLALGDERFQQFQQYSSQLPEANVADALAAQLYRTEAPLTPQQADQLAQVLVQNRFKPQPQPSPANSVDGVFIKPQAFGNRIAQVMQQGGMTLLDWQAPITDAALAQAGTVLSPAQLAALKDLQVQQTVQFQLAPPPPTSAATPHTEK